MIPAHIVTPTDRRRLNTQAERILDRLRQGTATNRELGDLCLNPRARVSELRQHGHTIEVTRGAGGLNTYTLVLPKGQLALLPDGGR